jgi:hypothetical protein
MQVIDYLDYQNVISGRLDINQAVVALMDHLNGFEHDLGNDLLQYLNDQKHTSQFLTSYLVTPRLRQRYPNLDLRYSVEFQDFFSFKDFVGYRMHPELDYQNFVCTFCGNGHVNKKLLLAALHRMGWYDPRYISKNFQFDLDVLDGHIQDFVPDQARLYRKFFIGDNSQDFFHTRNSFDYGPNGYISNLHMLEHKLTQSFVHVVGETMGTSYYPWITEKFLYSVVTRGLFVACAQPGWHRSLETNYGFRKYDRIFDYRFDDIDNPVLRIVEMISMLSKFSTLSPADWHDLYLMELDTIEHNYHNYFSKDYLKILAKFS